MRHVTKWHVLGAVVLVIVAILYVLLSLHGSLLWPALLGPIVVGCRAVVRRRRSAP